MKPRTPGSDPQDQLFQVRLIDIVDPAHPLIRLAGSIDWESLDNQLSAHFATTGATALPSRLVAGLLYLQHLHGLSDEAVLDRWLESPYYQYFCGGEFFEHRLPCHPTSLVKWRQRLGEEGSEWLLTETIACALRLGVISTSSLKRVIVDTTVQEKAIAHPTDSHLLNKARQHLVAIAHDQGIQLRQTYDKLCSTLVPKVGRYAHAKQYKRLRKAVKKLKGCLGRVYRDLLRQCDLERLNPAQRESLTHAERLLKQGRNSKNKLYSLHEPDVDCISKGKARKRYEFGVKASVAVTAKESFVVGARSYPGNPYDGHTLGDQLQQVEILTGVKPEESYVDRGYKGSGVEDVKVIVAGTKRLTAQERHWLFRRSSVEPVIGHMKSDGKLDRCFLKGLLGDAINVVLCGCGQNLRKLLRWFLWCLLRGYLAAINPERAYRPQGALLSA